MKQITVEQFLNKFNLNFENAKSRQGILNGMKERDSNIVDESTIIDYDFHMNYYKEIYKDELKTNISESLKKKQTTKKRGQKQLELDLQNEISVLKKQLDDKDREIEFLKNKLDALSKHDVLVGHNARGAGRKAKKITDKDRQDIILLYNSQRVTKTEIAKKYGVSITYIADILKQGIVEKNAITIGNSDTAQINFFS